INISTGRGTLIGRTGFRDVAALEFDRLGKLYGGLGPNDPNAGRIIAINPASAAGTLIGPSGFPEISGLAFLPGFDVTVAIGDTLKGEAGTVIEMPVLLELNADSVGSLGAVLKASGGILSFAGFTPGPIVPGAVFNVFSPAPDSVHIGFANLSGGSITQDGLLVTLRFALVANAPLGTTALLKFTEVSASDPQGDMLVAGGVNGLLTVVKFVIVAGNVGYCRPLDSTEPAIPVPALTAGMSQNNVVVRQTTTDAGGNFALANIVAGPNYSLSVRRASGGLDSAVHVTDAFLAFNGFLGTVALSGCQNLAADVDSNLSVQPRDALLIFNFFLGRLEAFPVEAWRAFPASYAIDASPIAWKKAPESIDYPNVSDNLNDQNFFAIARGDVDLSWPDTSSASSLAKAAELDGAAPAPLQLAVNSLPIAPDAKRVSWQILLEGSKVSHGIFAFGAELRYDAAELKISQVHWGNIVPAEGFMLDYNILPATAAPANEMDKPGGEELVSRMRFGGFATAGGSIRTNGVLLEVEAQLQNALPVGTRLPLRLVNVAVTTRAFTANQTANASFAQIKVPAKNGVVVTATVPARYALEANYPNPFNPSTRIRYQLPEAASVKLEIFNALGQKVRELVKDEQQAAGYYTIAWDGRNALGAASTSGVYFLKLEAKSATKSFTQSHKMLLVK
ncbi:MAG: FlgD immunoglobulin-like domain containing protein, partial [bacterium]